MHQRCGGVYSLSQLKHVSPSIFTPRFKSDEGPAFRSRTGSQPVSQCLLSRRRRGQDQIGCLSTEILICRFSLESSKASLTKYSQLQSLRITTRIIGILNHKSYTLLILQPRWRHCPFSYRVKSNIHYCPHDKTLHERSAAAATRQCAV